MSLGNSAESNLLLLVFENANWANVGDATGLRGSSSAGSFYASLHTADPGETGSQTTNESAYTNYARVGIARSSAGWTVSGTAPTQAANDAAVTFPQCGVTGSTVTHFEVGRESSGAGEALWIGALASQLIINQNITPSFGISQLVCTMD